MSAPAPLLRVSDVRIDIDGVPAVDGVAFETTGERVLVLGAPRALALATCGVLPVVRGRLELRGTPAKVAARARLAAGAALDPPLPAKWTPLEYATWSARLSGLQRGEAATKARDAVERLQLSALARSPLAALAPHARRATVLAAALATGAPVLVIEDPLSGLPDEAARAFAHVLVDALHDRAWVVFAARMPLTMPLALHAHEAVVASAARVDGQGPPAELAAAERRYVARVHGAIEPLAAHLAARGVAVEVQGAHVVFDLSGGMTTADLMAACVAADVAVVDLVPVARTLA